MTSPRRLRQGVDQRVEVGQALPVGAGEEVACVAVQVEQVGQVVFGVGGFLVRQHPVLLERRSLPKAS